MASAATESIPDKPITNNSIDDGTIKELLSLGIATKPQCIDAYLASTDKTDIECMKQYLMSNHSSIGDLETDSQPSYTDDIKENIDCNTENDTFEDEEDSKEEVPFELLPVGLLPKYEAEKFIVDEDTVEHQSPEYAWSICDATTFHVRRGPNYVSGQKSPSRPAIYEAFAMDTYSVPFKINNITQFMRTDEFIKQHRYRMNAKYPLPPILTINIMVPDYSPEIANHKHYDGKGYQVIIYAKLSSEVQRILMDDAQSDSIHPAIKLLSRFVQNSETDEATRDRFKCMGRVMNLKYTGFNWCTKKLIKEYNAKPFLAKCSTVPKHEYGRYLSVDLDAHQFGYVAKKAWNHIKHIMDHVVYDLAFVIQGDSNDELPERILTSVRMSKVAAQKQKPLPQIYVDRYLKNRGPSSRPLSPRQSMDSADDEDQDQDH